MLTLPKLSKTERRSFLRIIETAMTGQDDLTLKLGNSFLKRFPETDAKGQVGSMMMEIYRKRKDTDNTIRCSELVYRHADVTFMRVHAMTVLAVEHTRKAFFRQQIGIDYDDHLDKVMGYAKEALDLIPGMRDEGLHEDAEFPLHEKLELIAHCETSIAGVHSIRGDHVTAEFHYRMALARVNKPRTASVVGLYTSLRSQGKNEEADEVLEPCKAELERMGLLDVLLGAESHFEIPFA